MSISVLCSSCDAQFAAGDHLAGRKVKCPKCSSVVVVPENRAAKKVRPAADEEEGDEVPARKGLDEADDDDDDDRPRPRRSRTEDDEPEEDERPARQRRRAEEADERPRRKNQPRRKGSNKGLIIGLAVGGGVLLLLIAASVLGFFLLREPDNPKVTEANFDKVTIDMSLSDVEEILGRGQKLSRAEAFKAMHDLMPKEALAPEGATFKWKNKNETILLVFHPVGFIPAGWFVREVGTGSPKYKRLGSGRLQ